MIKSSWDSEALVQKKEKKRRKKKKGEKEEDVLLLEPRPRYVFASQSKRSVGATCGFCHKRFTNAVDLESHTASHLEAKNRSKCPLAKKGAKCVWPEAFDDRLAHILCHHYKLLAQCTVCDKTHENLCRTVPDGLVGKSIEARWLLGDTESAWCVGNVESYNAKDHTLLICYPDGSEVLEDLRTRDWRLKK